MISDAMSICASVLSILRDLPSKGSRPGRKILAAAVMVGGFLVVASTALAAHAWQALPRMAAIAPGTALFDAEQLLASEGFAEPEIRGPSEVARGDETLCVVDTEPKPGDVVWPGRQVALITAARAAPHGTYQTDAPPLCSEDGRTVFQIDGLEACSDATYKILFTVRAVDGPVTIDAYNVGRRVMAGVSVRDELGNKLPIIHTGSRSGTMWQRFDEATTLQQGEAEDSFLLASPFRDRKTGAIHYPRQLFMSIDTSNPSFSYDGVIALTFVNLTPGEPVPFEYIEH
ncbi:MAG: hypothetical protein ACYC5Q_07170 [Thermoleophilia bacterium]